MTREEVDVLLMSAQLLLKREKDEDLHQDKFEFALECYHQFLGKSLPGIYHPGMKNLEAPIDNKMLEAVLKHGLELLCRACALDFGCIPTSLKDHPIMKKILLEQEHEGYVKAHAFVNEFHPNRSTNVTPLAVE